MPITVVTGPDEFLKERFVSEEISATLHSNVKIFRNDYIPDQYELGEVNAFLHYDSLPSLDDSLTNVVLLNQSKPFESSIQCRSVHIPALKSFDNNNEVLSWILSEGKRFNIDLTNVASALFVNSGIRLRKLSSEVRKISEICETGAKVNLTDVKNLISLSAEITPHGIVNAINDGQPDLALRIYDRLNAQEDETGWIQAFLLNHVTTLIRVIALSELNLGLSAICSNLALHPYVVTNQYMTIVKKWSIKTLSDSSACLIKAGVLHRSGKPGADFLIQSEILRLSREARNANRSAV